MDQIYLVMYLIKIFLGKFSTGSLGHGLPVAAGLALAAKNE